MVVFRIEDARGDGPYAGSIPPSLQETTGSWDAMAHHPTPVHDPGIKRRMAHEEYCGFKNLRQLLTWVYRRDALEELTALGFRIAVYRVDFRHATVGYAQVVFKRHEAMVHSHLSLTNYLKDVDD